MSLVSSALKRWPEVGADRREAAEPEPPLEKLRKQIAWLRTEVDPESSRFGAAVLLLSSAVLEQNIDKLARFTGLPREFVARCARRLVDNGVWRNGALVTSWKDPAADRSDFWRDVEVAEGKLCRRLGDGERPEWAPPGEWWKSYDFTERKSEVGIVAKYETRQRWSPEPDPMYLDMEVEESEEVAAVADGKDAGSAPRGRPGGDAKPVSAEVQGFLAGSMPGAKVDSRSRMAVVGGPIGPPELFAGAVWLT